MMNIKFFILPVLVSTALLIGACGSSKTTTKKIVEINKAPVDTGVYD
jgi:hypothetical protein